MKAPRTVIVGLGNPILTDDAVGPAVARLVHQRLGDPSVEFQESSVGGITLVELLAGYDRAIIIDAVKTKGGRVGDCRVIDPEASRLSRGAGITHEIGLLEGLELGRRVGLQMPEYLRIYAVEVADPFTFSTEMTPEVRSAVPAAAQHILDAEFPAAS